MLKVLKLQKKRTALQAQLKQLRDKRKKLRSDETELQNQLEAATDVSPELENKVDELTQQQTETEDQIAELQDQIDELNDEIAAAEAEPGAQGDPDDEHRSATPAPATPARRAAAAPVAETRFNCRSRCFASRQSRDAFYAQTEVAAFVQRVRTMCGAAAASGKRSVSGAELSIPTQALDVIRDNLDQYSKLLAYVRKRSVKGKARQNVIGDIPEGVWMEMAGALNDLQFSISDIELDGYKVGGVIIIDNYLLEDSDIALGEEVMFCLGQSIGYALDKGLVYGKGPSSKMPVGIVTRLSSAETLELIYCPYGDAEYARRLQLNYAAKGELDTLGWLRVPVSFLPESPWYFPTVTPIDLGSGGTTSPAVYDMTYDDGLFYGANSSANVSTTISPSGQLPAAILLRYVGAITSPRIRLVGATSGKALGLCSLDASTAAGDTLEFSTVRTDSHVYRISADGAVTDLLDKVDLSSEPFFQLPVDEPCILSVESDEIFTGTAELTVYYYSRSV